jgi:hypothetical protein
MPARSSPVSDCFGHAGSMIYQFANARPDGQTVLSVFFPAAPCFAVLSAGTAPRLS